MGVKLFSRSPRRVNKVYISWPPPQPSVVVPLSSVLAVVVFLPPAAAAQRRPLREQLLPLLHARPTLPPNLNSQPARLQKRPQLSFQQPPSSTMSSSNANNMRQTPLTCSGHTRPVVDLAFSELNPNDDAAYYCISACKGQLTVG